MFKPSYIASSIMIALIGGSAVADESSKTQLDEITVLASAVSSAVVISEVSAENIVRRYPNNIKSLFQQELDVSVNNLSRSRAGNDGINVRGLQGNRVEMTLDGIPLSESQENKLFTTVGMAFGRGDFIEPSGLRSAQIKRSGSNSGLSGSVNFNTLEPEDLLKERALAGVLSSAYSGVDRGIAGTVGFAAQNERYQGLLLSTLRKGHETKTHGKKGGIGTNRTKADPADYKSGYVLLKNYYQLNDSHRIGLIFEYLKRDTERDLQSQLGTISGRTGITNNLADTTTDTVVRNRFSLNHLYSREQLHIESAVYMQHSQTRNHRLRHTISNGVAIQRLDEAENKDKIYGINSSVRHYLDTTLPQIVRYGVSYNYQDLSNRLITTSADNRKPSADTKQIRTTAFIEDEISWGSLVLTPHLGLIDYRLKPSDRNGYIQRADDYAPISGQHKTAFLPKFGLLWDLTDEFKPYLHYSRGYKAPSVQQLTTSFGNDRGMLSYSIVGNPQLKPETADNFELGFKGQNARLDYRVSAYYHRYKNFIDYQTMISNRNLLVIQYQNIAKAKVYGIEAEAKWRFTEQLSATTGFVYSRGKSIEQDGTIRPINTIQPLKVRIGLAYQSEGWGADLLLTHVRAKADKDIDGTMYNPSVSYNLLDLGGYWQPLNGLMFTAGINNVLNKKYWNWTDLSHLAARANETANNDSSAGTISVTNADAYSAPGRHFTLGVRYEF
ncbi:TonB-dependent hemoglobin/transferrin/lactoferrin family receptor [Testudinibacter sp. TR-2022]|uniref:TonB-dependent hemoglobin/transferrin/lactoferrin family receptor n=1 Tax=Testudinibacter sp. TR-2022 TaxID=2585029 RepID=UPI00111A8842|nr:TonB-dependent hemoglobin/transferrin/lactoferrin family receptor [Testudinibacter sp. TR-2022]TNH09712.1 TonB-dependent hemoglobin/transferrin/lactoferrin family receptor [Pasteurellaceae bacterium Phil11]TNH23366.1 TonB-dependent hemoglobin/transferrin/lactoferrin family receptor [Testudinibacter sp. TR-2022]TNH26810.1 TonB-dependent hemoglobin/transferrin/lactoferrin family receptor [Testudinibacter sp. TR-2022]